MTEKTYSTLLQQCQAALRSGFAVIADATFTDAENRSRVVDAFHGKDIGTHWLTGSGPWPAAAGSYPHVCAWLSLPPAEREARVRQRAQSAVKDSSDVTPDMLHLIAKEEPELSAPWQRISAAAAPPDVADVVAGLVQAAL